MPSSMSERTLRSGAALSQACGSGRGNCRAELEALCASSRSRGAKRTFSSRAHTELPPPESGGARVSHPAHRKAVGERDRLSAARAWLCVSDDCAADFDRRDRWAGGALRAFPLPAGADQSAALLHASADHRSYVSTLRPGKRHRAVGSRDRRVAHAGGGVYGQLGMARDRPAGLESRQVDCPDLLAQRGGALGVEALSPPLCLHRCQGLEDREALGSAACGIASVFTRHPHRSCSAADLKGWFRAAEKSRFWEASKGEVRPKSTPNLSTSASNAQLKPFCYGNPFQ